MDTVFVKEAEHALARSRTGQRAGNAVATGGASFTAVIAAVAAAEAYLSEVLAHLEDKSLIQRDHRNLIRSKDGLWAKYQALARIFHGDDLHKEEAYSPFVALVHLRNVLIHRSAQFLELDQWPRDIVPYRGTIPHEEGEELDWTSQVLTEKTASWAVSTVKNFLEAVDGYIPDPARFPDPATQ